MRENRSGVRAVPGEQERPDRREGRADQRQEQRVVLGGDGKPEKNAGVQPPSSFRLSPVERVHRAQPEGRDRYVEARQVRIEELPGNQKESQRGKESRLARIKAPTERIKDGQ